MFNVPHTVCGGVYFVYKGDVALKMTDPLAQVSDFQHVDGTPLDPSAVAQCDSCGVLGVPATVFDPTTWTEIPPATYATLTTAVANYTRIGSGPVSVVSSLVSGS